ncbi:OLC1v1007033C1 [Oldenlandia corymbosa var. corymbosa]|uniref:Pre-mRNA-splicing factor SLU7 n=1 Tax=Oldenlandia corymbosa var. corymbosa TaxID=529605 RepID=A0AAV1DIA6_OLDCO|nr:OLC1v1007033C1 [Oldenlandia corymbosa var. corymbosa]
MEDQDRKELDLEVARLTDTYMMREEVLDWEEARRAGPFSDDDEDGARTALYLHRVGEAYSKSLKKKALKERKLKQQLKKKNCEPNKQGREPEDDDDDYADLIKVGDDKRKHMDFAKVNKCLCTTGGMSIGMIRNLHIPEDTSKHLDVNAAEHDPESMHEDPLPDIHMNEKVYAIKHPGFGVQAA